jgi:hypothetical protein
MTVLVQTSSNLPDQEDCGKINTYMSTASVIRQFIWNSK